LKPDDPSLHADQNPTGLPDEGGLKPYVRATTADFLPDRVT